MTTAKAIKAAPPIPSEKEKLTKRTPLKRTREVYAITEFTKIGPLILDKKLSKKEFNELASKFPDLRLEREKNGKTTIMSPAKFGTGKRELHLGSYLFIWWKENGEPGEVFGPTTGIELADTSIKSPDCGWISPERMAQIAPEQEEGEYLQAPPDFIVEIRSISDSLPKLKRKMKNSWMKNGVRLGWLIDPCKEKAYIYREGQDMEEVNGFEGKALSGEKVLPGFELALEKLRIEKRK